jgi:hypothetical protein
MFVIGKLYPVQSNKHSSLLRKSVNHGQKKFHEIGSRPHVHEEENPCEISRKRSYIIHLNTIMVVMICFVGPELVEFVGTINYL